MIENGWWSKAKKLPSPNYDQRPDVEIDALVIHNISLPPNQYGTGQVQRFFQNQLDYSEHSYFESLRDIRVSAHVFIERDGDATQFVSFNERAWHAGKSVLSGASDCNNFSIGVELEGCDDEAYSDAQYESLLKLTQALMLAYPSISVDRIVGHSDIAPGRKSDPGAAFDWQRYSKSINQTSLGES